MKNKQINTSSWSYLSIAEVWHQLVYSPPGAGA